MSYLTALPSAATSDTMAAVATATGEHHHSEVTVSDKLFESESTTTTTTFKILPRQEKEEEEETKEGEQSHVDTRDMDAGGESQDDDSRLTVSPNRLPPSSSRDMMTLPSTNTSNNSSASTMTTPQSKFYVTSFKNLLGYGGANEAGRAYAPAPESWLLRFFKSEFFDCWIAVSYLFKYKTTGIQDYICRLMRRFPVDQVQFFLPQLCQLVVFRPDGDSTSVEFFILETCYRSSHFALLTLWQLEALVADFEDPSSAAVLKKYPQPYLLCRKILRKCQAILITGDLRHMYDQTEGKVDSNAKYVAMGIGYMMASIASPYVVNQMKELPLNHSRRKIPMMMTMTMDDHHHHRESVELIHSDTSLANDMVIIQPKMPRRPPTAEELHQGKAFSLATFLTKYHATSEKLSFNTTTSSGFPASKLINQHFFYSQIKFILTLMDIGTRLLDLPREARSSSLRAEVSLLNHNLPAKVCIPFWCPGTPDKPYHHYIVRIPPEDAVVLNSKDRVPYLVLIEVLELDEHQTLEDLLLSHGNVVKPSTKEDDYSSSMRALEPSKKSYSSSSVTATKSKLARSRSRNMTDSSPSEASDSEEKVRSTHDHLSPMMKVSRIEESRKRIESFASALRENELQKHGFPHRAASEGMSMEKQKYRQIEEEISECMKTASVMLAQLSLQDATTPSLKDVTLSIRNNIIQELMILEEKRMAYGLSRESDSMQSVLDPEAERILAQEDPSASVFKELWEIKTRRIQNTSPYGHLPSWKLFSIIVKTGADLRQEQFACQLISEMQRVWKQEDLPIRAYCFHILVTSRDSGIIETIPNTISLHSLKKEAYASRLNEPGRRFTLYDHFQMQFGPIGSSVFIQAQENFVNSLASYSLISYLLNVKDRHNGNILIDSQGHLIHIDFGFMLGNAPGRVGFEYAPFKFTQEYMDVMDGFDSEIFKRFRSLLIRGLLALRKYADNFVLLVEMMQKDSKLPCFALGEQTATSLRERFQLGLTESQFEQFVDRLITSSYNNLFTRLYDNFQHVTNGIIP